MQEVDMLSVLPLDNVIEKPDGKTEFSRSREVFVKHPYFGQKKVEFKYDLEGELKFSIPSEVLKKASGHVSGEEEVVINPTFKASKYHKKFSDFDRIINEKAIFIISADRESFEVVPKGEDLDLISLKDGKVKYRLHTTDDGETLGYRIGKNGVAELLFDKKSLAEFNKQLSIFAAIGVIAVASNKDKEISSISSVKYNVYAIFGAVKISGKCDFDQECHGPGWICNIFYSCKCKKINNKWVCKSQRIL